LDDDGGPVVDGEVLERRKGTYVLPFVKWYHVKQLLPIANLKKKNLQSMCNDVSRL
jgi:hypothetical protein